MPKQVGGCFGRNHLETVFGQLIADGFLHRPEARRVVRIVVPALRVCVLVHLVFGGVFEPSVQSRVEDVRLCDDAVIRAHERGSAGNQA